MTKSRHIHFWTFHITPVLAFNRGFGLKLTVWPVWNCKKCEQRTQLNTFCRAFCLNKSHVFVPGSLQTAQCRGRHIRFAVMPKGHKPFARCGAPDQVQGFVLIVFMTHNYDSYLVQKQETMTSAWEDVEVSVIKNGKWLLVITFQWIAMAVDASLDAKILAR